MKTLILIFHLLVCIFESVTGHYACAVSALLACGAYYNAVDYTDIAGDYMDIWDSTGTTVSSESGGITYGSTTIGNIGPGFVDFCAGKNVSVTQNTDYSPNYNFFTNCIDRGDIAVVHCGIISSDTGERAGHSMAAEGYATLRAYNSGNTVHTLMVFDGWGDKSAYQAMPYSRGAWHVGVNYGGRLFGTVNNRNSVGIEMCVQAGFDYDKAFANTAEVCRQLMSELNIPADRVVQHYDVCAKNCPSAIRAKNDWNRFKKLIQGKEKENSPSGGKEITLTEELRVIFPELSRGCTGTAVKMLQVFLQVQADGIFGTETENALRTFQKNTNQSADGICGKNSWTAFPPASVAQAVQRG